MTDPSLSDAERQKETRALMKARRSVKAALDSKDRAAIRKARASVQKAKLALGERGPPWSNDGSPDVNRHLAKNTVYAAWFAKLGEQDAMEVPSKRRDKRPGAAR